MFNDDFFPTPEKLIQKMWDKVKNRDTLNTILEPSAGRGDIIEYIKNNYNYTISCIEKNPDLQHVLIGKGFNLIDSDFLNYSGLDKFDLIIGNPPFSQGAEHLLKAIEILYSGQIVFLLNAETIRNPYSNTRKTLATKLSELNAEIEFIPNAFMESDRKTKVEIALIYIEKIRKIEFDLFNDSREISHDYSENIEYDNEIAASNSIEFLVEEFNASVREGIETILYYHKHPRVKRFIALMINDKKHSQYRTSRETLNQEVNEQINILLQHIRKTYWIKILDLEDVKQRMTENKKREYYDSIEKQSTMDFTESNIRAFIIKLIGNYESILTEAVAELFDKFTREYSWHEECRHNIHYFNGWKTNKAFYVNKKIILPFYNGFTGWNGQWEVSYSIQDKLNDIDIVMNYFSAGTKYISIVDALKASLKSGISRKIQSTFFTLSVFKKGTLHLIFNDDSILRRFNIVACKQKKWLPQDYGSKKYETMNTEEQAVVESFEGKDSYENNLNNIGFDKKEILLLG